MGVYGAGSSVNSGPGCGEWFRLLGIRLFEVWRGRQWQHSAVRIQPRAAINAASSLLGRKEKCHDTSPYARRCHDRHRQSCPPRRRPTLNGRTRERVRLRGDRFKPLTYDEMTPAQKTMIEHVLTGPRGSTDGPFNVQLRSPEMGDLGQQFGAATRFATSVPRKLYELAIIITARHWTAQFEWTAHHRSALQAGVSPAVCDAIAQGRRPSAMPPDEEAVYNFATELLEKKQVSDATFDAAKKASRRAGRRRSDQRDGLVRDGVDVSERRSVSAARRHAARAQSTKVVSGFSRTRDSRSVRLSWPP